MAESFARRARILHVFRVATGATTVATLGLTLPIVTPCISQVFFFIATVAGAAENTQGFQLRSASLSLFGATLGALCYAAVAVIAHTSSVAAFFLALPPLAAFSFLRSDPALAPAPALANVVVGLLLITNADTGRPAVVPALRATLLDALQAWACAVAVNLVFPARAADEARLHFAAVLRRLGAAFSTVATSAFPQPVAQSHSSRPPPLVLSHSSLSVDSTLSYISLQLPDLGRGPTALPPQLAALEHSQLERSKTMLKTTAASLAFLTTLPPFGRSRTEDHAILARTRMLITAARHEPHIPWGLRGSAVSMWCNAERLDALHTALAALVNRAATLESVTLEESRVAGSSTAAIRESHRNLQQPQHGEPVLFTPESFAKLVGSAYIPLWYAHLAVCAASCAGMSSDLQMCRSAAVHPLDKHFDATRWRKRRTEMYIGYLLTRRLSWRRKGGCAPIEEKEQRDMETAGVRGLGLEFNVRCPHHLHRTHHGHRDSEENGNPQLMEKCIAQRQAMSFFAIGCHSASEAVTRVQEAVKALGSAGNGKARYSDAVILPLLPGVTAFKPVIARLRAALGGYARKWEIRFALTHFLLLACTLALALFLPFGSKFRAGEVAWSYTSAALAAQLSAEPTVFIGVWRVGATALGCMIGLGVNELVGLLARTELGDGALFARLPVLFILCVLTLLVIPPRLRYLSFLTLVTTNIIMYCPRATPPTCPTRSADNVRRAACLPSWEFALSRAGNVSVGVVLALLCHVLMWPRFAGESALRCMLTALRRAARQTRKLRLRYFGLMQKNIDIFAKRHHNVDMEQDKLPNHELDDKEGDNGSDDDDYSGELYPRDTAVEAELQEQVGKHVENAAALIHGEAGVWQRGPLAARALLRSILDEMLAVSVSVRELGGVQERRAIFDTEYGGDVFAKLVQPLLPQYETLQVSVTNVVAVTAAAAVQSVSDPRELAERLDVLRMAIAHVGRCRGDLRGEARRRAGRVDVARTFRGDVRVRLVRWAEGRSRNRSRSRVDDADRGTRRYAYDDLDTAARSEARGADGLELDEVVLYDAMTMAFDGCVSAFVRVALSVLEDGDAQLRTLRPAWPRRRRRRS